MTIWSKCSLNNTYSLVRVKFQLYPFKKAPTTVKSKRLFSLITYKEFEPSYRKGNVAHVLMAKRDDPRSQRDYKRSEKFVDSTFNDLQTRLSPFNDHWKDICHEYSYIEFNISIVRWVWCWSKLNHDRHKRRISLISFELTSKSDN